MRVQHRCGMRVLPGRHVDVRLFHRNIHSLLLDLHLPVPLFQEMGCVSISHRRHDVHPDNQSPAPVFLDDVFVLCDVDRCRYAFLAAALAAVLIVLLLVRTLHLACARCQCHCSPSAVLHTNALHLCVARQAICCCCCACRRRKKKKAVKFEVRQFDAAKTSSGTYRCALLPATCLVSQPASFRVVHDNCVRR